MVHANKPRSKCLTLMLARFDPHLHAAPPFDDGPRGIEWPNLETIEPAAAEAPLILETKETR